MGDEKPSDMRPKICQRSSACQMTMVGRFSDPRCSEIQPRLLSKAILLQCNYRSEDSRGAPLFFFFFFFFLKKQELIGVRPFGKLPAIQGPRGGHIKLMKRFCERFWDAETLSEWENSFTSQPVVISRRNNHDGNFAEALRSVFRQLSDQNTNNRSHIVGFGWKSDRLILKFPLT